ncbi:RbsD/FucU family protein [Rathayibacter sp. SD072]|uniref:RbsD/FucU family protein n=1 Tax=Rathayibacter sp. SD072 TaxID=2781731 RepID=UPI001A96DF93|nr:RbsD/FucU domain-containing protein [Rathayibacter sp. SD072]MBO0982624.1 fucose-binding protein [Rathayibacter sp. SD072]
MLKTVDPILTPDLLWALAAMGHGDTLAVVDANYPAYALHSRVLPLAGADMASAVTAITSLFPVDTAIEPAVLAMVPDDDVDLVFPSHRSISRTLSRAEGRDVVVAPLARTPFYERARSAFAVVLTGETSAFACFLITKGVVSAS